MSQWGARSPVHFFEEPVFAEVGSATLARSDGSPGVRVLTPTLPHGLTGQEVVETQRSLLDDYLKSEGLAAFVAWYYTPMALAFSGHLKPTFLVYD